MKESDTQTLVIPLIKIYHKTSRKSNCFIKKRNMLYLYKMEDIC